VIETDFFAPTHPACADCKTLGHACIVHEQQRTEKITIPACVEHDGFFSLTVTVPWYCIFCGRERGEKFDGLSYDGSRRLHVSCWRNACGHVETYKEVREWLRANREAVAQ
jgi:hypothetical protein